MRQRKEEEECNLQINAVPRSWCSGNPEKSKALMTPTNAKIAVLTGTRPLRSWRCHPKRDTEEMDCRGYPEMKGTITLCRGSLLLQPSLFP